MLSKEWLRYRLQLLLWYQILVHLDYIQGHTVLEKDRILYRWRIPSISSHLIDIYCSL